MILCPLKFISSLIIGADIEKSHTNNETNLPTQEGRNWAILFVQTVLLIH